MPFINIHLEKKQSKEFITSISDVIHEALIESWSIPEKDKFHFIHEHQKHHFLIDKQMWGMNRSDDVIILQIITSPRTKEQKLHFYQNITKKLQERLQMREDDVMINIVTSNVEDWSFGKGKAQLLEE